MDSVPVTFQIFGALGIVLSVLVTAIVFYLAAREWEDPRRACYWEDVGCMYFIFATVFLGSMGLFIVYVLINLTTKTG